MHTNHAIQCWASKSKKSWVFFFAVHPKFPPPGLAVTCQAAATTKLPCGSVARPICPPEKCKTNFHHLHTSWAVSVTTQGLHNIRKAGSAGWAHWTLRSEEYRNTLCVRSARVFLLLVRCIKYADWKRQLLFLFNNLPFIWKAHQTTAEWLNMNLLSSASVQVLDWLILWLIRLHPFNRHVNVCLFSSALPRPLTSLWGLTN